MTTWQDVISDFKAEKAEYDGAAATLVMMYLAVTGKDYAYNMAKEFREGITEKNGWSEERKNDLRKLRDQNQLHVLLSKMEKKGLIVSQKMNSGRKTRYYRINPLICMGGPNSEPCKIPGYCISRGKVPCSRTPKIYEERLQLAQDFLNEQSDSNVEPFFKRWSSIKVFDFSSFQQFLRDEANRKGNPSMTRIIEESMENYCGQQKTLRSLPAH
jgi:hypothetical protein